MQVILSALVLFCLNAFKIFKEDLRSKILLEIKIDESEIYDSQKKSRIFLFSYFFDNLFYRSIKPFFPKLDFPFYFYWNRLAKSADIDPFRKFIHWITSLYYVFAFKGALSGLGQFSATENPLEIIKNVFPFTSKACFLFLRCLSFCLDSLVMQKNSLIRKTRLISKFMTSKPN